MAKRIITVIDAAGIQDYIFGSNRLKHNIGASYLVEQSGKPWVNACLQPGAGELFYSGGGKTVLFFETLAAAQAFAGVFSKRVLEQAPGLQVYLAHHEMDWARDALGGEDGALAAAFDKVAEKKNSTPNRVAQLGWAVTADCQYTGLPAAKEDEQKKRVSYEVFAKEYAADAANQTLSDNLNLKTAEFPLDMDDFGRTHGDSSYIALVHVDGNGMGKRFKALGEKYKSCAENDAFVTALRELSAAVTQVSWRAMQATIDFLQTHITDGKITDKYRAAMAIELENDLLPLRPLVMGGDDVTFVCEGRLGLALAHRFLTALTSQPLPDTNKPMTARAGVAIVKSHYPFAQAYQLVEALAASAKQDAEGANAIDWHFATSGLLDDLAAIRKREYTVPPGRLHARPLLLNHDSEWRTWGNFTNIVTNFATQWGDKRNKVKELREVLRQGDAAVQAFLALYGLPALPKLVGQDAEGGWANKTCTVFDAIEALDWFLILE